MLDACASSRPRACRSISRRRCARDFPARASRCRNNGSASRRCDFADADGLLALLSLRIDEALLDAAPRLRVVANYAVGYDNVDLGAATRARDHRHQYARRAHRRDRRSDYGAHAGGRAARARGRRMLREGAWRAGSPSSCRRSSCRARSSASSGSGRIGRRWRGARAGSACASLRRRCTRAGRALDRRAVATRRRRHPARPATPETRHVDASGCADEAERDAGQHGARRLVDEAALVAALARGHLRRGLDVYETSRRSILGSTTVRAWSWRRTST